MKCANCNSDAARRCSRCTTVYYCSAACQKEHWPSHRQICVAPAATEAKNDNNDDKIKDLLVQFVRGGSNTFPKLEHLPASEADEIYQTAIQRLPRSEVEYLKACHANAVREGLEPSDAKTPSAEETAAGIVMMRLMNPICNHCRRYPAALGALLLCKTCCATWFCSVACKRRDKRHKQWCANPDAPRDFGPHAMTVTPVTQFDRHGKAKVDAERNRKFQGMPGSATHNSVMDAITTLVSGTSAIATVRAPPSLDGAEITFERFAESDTPQASAAPQSSQAPVAPGGPLISEVSDAE
jgi:hypothetical protein